MSLLRELYYRLPPAVRGALLVKRRSPIWLRAGIVFVHIPKAAGTSINHALYGQFIGHARAVDIDHWGSAEVKALPSFAVTRNPWDRLVSAFRYGQRLHQFDWKMNRSVPRVIRDQVPRHESFGKFVTEWLRHQDPARLNQIFQPQANFICDAKGNLLVDHVGRVEELRPTLDFIRDHTGTELIVEKANPSGAPVDYRTFYTPELVDLVGGIYARDLEAFRYDFDCT